MSSLRPRIHQLESFQSICMTTSPRPDSTQQCQKLISGMKHVARLLPAAGCCCVFILCLYADETKELARLSAVEQEEKEGKKNFYFEYIRKAGKCCVEGKKCENFLLFVCLFVWLSRITLNGFSFTLMTSFISFMFELFLVLFLFPLLWVVRAELASLHKKTYGKLFFLETCNNSIFLLLSFRIRHVLNRSFPLARRPRNLWQISKKSRFENDNELRI